jgi:hypothetical protein
LNKSDIQAGLGRIGLGGGWFLTKKVKRNGRETKQQRRNFMILTFSSSLLW